MKHLLKISVAAGMAFGAATLSANAADAESTWTMGETNGNSFVYMSDVSGPSVTLNCSDRFGVQAVVYLNGNSMDELTISGKPRTRNVEISTESTETRDGDWAYLRNAKTLISTRGWQGKRIFNAAVTGSPVAMDIARIGSVNLTLPAVNDDFRTFVSNCSSL